MQTLGGMDGSRLSAREFVFGDGCFFLKGVAPPDVTMEEIFASCGPWMGLQLVALILVMLFPESRCGCRVWRDKPTLTAVEIQGICLRDGSWLNVFGSL